MKLQKFLSVFWLCAIVLTMSFTPEEKFFEGEIEYKVTAESFVKGLDANEIIKQFGNKSFFWFKNGDYKQTANGMITKLDFFDHNTVKYYSGSQGSDTFLVQDASLKTDTVIRMENTSSVKKVAGYMCDKFVIHVLSGPEKTSLIMRFYYNEVATRLDPAWYAKAESHSMKLIREHTHSVPLEIEIEYSNFKIVLSATKITRKSLTDEEIHLPKNAKVKI